jgi:transcriptional regulator with XRE-family HTH domain
MTMARPLLELAAYRKAHRLTRKELADRLKVTETTVWRWEAGERRPAAKYANKVSKMTGISVGELLGVEP